MKKNTATKKESKPMKLEVKKINTKQYETREEYNKAHKNDKKTEDKKKVRSKMRLKKPWNPKSKIWKRKQVIFHDWRKVTIEDPWMDGIRIWRPRVFKSPDELIELYNCYLASIREKVKNKELVPVRTEEKEDDFLDVLDDAIQSSKNENFKIDNTLVAKYEITEWYKRKETPTIWGFLLFCWWISYDSWENYKKKEEFFGTISTIENSLESILTQRAMAWEIPSNIAQFVLNVKYNRVPKSKSEEIVKTDVIDESELFD